MTTLTMTTLLSAALLLASGWTEGRTTPSLPDAGTPGAVRLALAERARYVDGTYTARGWYGSLPSSITVTVTLAQGVITTVTVKTHATNPTSLDYQRRFAAAVPRIVVGRPIGEVKVGRLAGSSGTPDGFNDALNKIRQQASD